MKSGDVVDVTVTYLEMREPPDEPLPPAPAAVEVRKLENVSAATYRRLYNGVGAAYYWVDRNALSDTALEQLVNAPGVEVHVLYVDGREAGYAELDRRAPGEVRLAYFGLMPSFIGRGLGRWFLAWAVSEAWASAPRRIWVDTCTLDHPRALRNYEDAGFERFGLRGRKFVVPVPGEA